MGGVISLLGPYYAGYCFAKEFCPPICPPTQQTRKLIGSYGGELKDKKLIRLGNNRANICKKLNSQLSGGGTYSVFSLVDPSATKKSNVQVRIL